MGYGVCKPPALRSGWRTRKSGPHLARLETRQLLRERVKPVLAPACNDHFFALGVEAAREALADARGAADDEDGRHEGGHARGW